MATSKKTTKAKAPKKAAAKVKGKAAKGASPAKAKGSVKAPSRAAAPDAKGKSGPAPKEPVWVKPMTTPRVQIRLPDGSIATQKAADDLAMWESARLRIVFGEHVNWHDKAGTEWHEKAIATAMKLVGLVKPEWIVFDVTDRWDVPVLKPVAYSRAEAEKLLGRTLFRKVDVREPWTELRTGDELAVQHERDVLALRNAVELHLPPTAENVALLERTLDDLVGSVPFAWAGVGYGLSGWASEMALTKDTRKVTPARGSRLRATEEKSPVLDADWLLWLGELWQATPSHTKVVEGLEQGPSREVERRGQLVRITVPAPESVDDAKGAKAAKKLAEDRKAAAKKIGAIEERALLKRLDRGKRR